MQKGHSKTRKKGFNVSLRLWSDRVSIADILKRSAIEVEHCHRLGEIIVINGRSTDRVARRHYAALQNLGSVDVERLAIWLVDIQEKLTTNDEILLGLRSGQIEGVIWIALFGDELQFLPRIDPDLVARFLRNNVRTLVENYTDIDGDGLPRKTWLTSGSDQDRASVDSDRR